MSFPVRIGLRNGGLVIIEKDSVDVSALDLESLAYALGGYPRFGNQLDRPYSDAEHSCHLAELAEGWDSKLAALFHESAEVLGIGDSHYALKHKDTYKLEDRILAAVFEKFGVAPMDKELRDLDRKLGHYEAATIIPAKAHFPVDFRLPVRYRNDSPVVAGQRWLTAYYWYKDSKKFSESPYPLPRDLRPGVPFSLQIPKGIDPLAVEQAALKHTSITKVSDGSYLYTP